MAIQVKELTDPLAIEKYVERFAELVGVRIPAEYLQRGTIYGCFDTDNRLVGGYTLVTTPPYRGIVFLPDEIRSGHWLFDSVSLNNVLEVNGLWLERNVRMSAPDWYSFLWKLVHSLGQTRKRYILVWYNNLNKHLRRFYGRMQKEVIYTGCSQPNGAERTHPEICVAYTTRWKLYCSLLKHLPKLLRIRFAKFRRGFNSERGTRATERQSEDGAGA